MAAPAGTLYQFVFESSFLERYDIDAQTLEKIRNDEVELLNLGMRWLKFILFKQGEFKLKSPHGAD